MGTDGAGTGRRSEHSARVGSTSADGEASEERAIKTNLDVGTTYVRLQGAALQPGVSCSEAVPLLERNAARVNAGLAEPRLRAQDLLWGEDEAIARAGAGAFDVVLGADVLYFQDAADVSKLVRTLERLLAPGGTVVLAYEWREDWETTGAFHDACKAAGLLDEMVDLHETDREDAVLFLLRRGAAAAECGPV